MRRGLVLGWGVMGIKDWLRDHGVPVRRSKLEAQAIMMAIPMQIERERGYSNDVISDRFGNTCWYRFYWGKDGERGHSTVNPCPWNSPRSLKARADDQRERGVTVVVDDDGYEREVPMTPEQLNDPQRYRGCIPVKP